MTDPIIPPSDLETPAGETVATPPDPTPPAGAESVRLVKIKFRSAGRHYDFNAQNLTLALGNKVVVETDRGRALGEVVAEPRLVSGSAIPDGLKTILRHATTDDLNMATTYATREADALRYCRARTSERKMEMKLVRAEYLFDGSKIIFYFTADGRVDFRELVKDLAHHFHTRIEMRQIGVRDEAKLTGGIGVCGRELCCSSYLTEFAPVSVKMAKEQGLALNPTKISGQCGRLLCCLAYEYETYCDLKRALPKCGRKIVIDGREGEVIDQHLLRQTVTVSFGPDQKVVLSAEEIEKGVMPPRLTAAPPQGEKSGGIPSQRNSERNHRGEQQDSRPRGQQQHQGQQSRQQRSGQPQRDQQSSRPQTAAAQPAAKQQQQQQRPKQNAATPGNAPPQKIKSVQQQTATAVESPPSAEGRRKRNRNRRRGRKPGSTNTPEAGE